MYNIDFRINLSAYSIHFKVSEIMEKVRDFIFLGSKITADDDCSLKLKDACSLEEKIWPA